MPPPVDARRALFVEVSAGPDTGTRVRVDDERTIGSSERADLVLTDRTVSRRHALVRPGRVGVEVVDASSRNGTWLGEHRVQSVDLAPGAEVRLGGTTLRIVADEAPAESEESTRTSFGRFVGSSPRLRPLYRAMDAAIGSTATVLIEGESGTGKELLSEALHEEGPRKDGPFVVVDCGSIPANLIESELFGHIKGAFTGALGDRPGAFEEAHGGSIFLDEVGELPLAMQTRLLRVLDRRRVRRVGASQPIDVDVRVIAATNRNLEREVEEGRFRLDLFHRLAVVLLRVPPLRARLDDLDIVVGDLLRQVGADPALATPELLDKLRAHAWPGNVRELRNHIERVALLGDAELPTAVSTSDSVEGIAALGQPFRIAKAAALSRFTELYVQNMLARHDGNVSHAAKAAGVARRHFQRLKAPSE